MRRELALVLVLSAFALARSGGAEASDYAAPAQNAAGGQYYCPPGSKFCPAPGTNNTVFLDTHFGMDAKTGAVTAYKGTAHPNDVANGPGTGEAVLYTSPPISVENRYVPYPGAPQTNMAASTGTPYRQPIPAAPAYQAQTYAPTQTMVAQTGPVRRGDAESEVANRQTARDKDISRGDKEVPWWKGGWWRNRKDDSEPRDSRSDSASKSSGSRQPSGLSASDDMWGEGDYDGYNPDGSFGGQPAAGDPYAAPAFGGGATASSGHPAYADPYSQPQPSYPQSQTSGGFIGDAYTLPNSPGPSSPYQPGYVYPGTTYTADPYQQPASAPQQYTYTASPTPVTSYPATTYPAPAPVVSAPPQPGDSFMPPPPGGQTYQASAPAPVAAPAAEPGAGSPQFERAVRLVKENRFSEAKTALLDETARNPSSAAAWRWLGDCHYNLLELDAAIASYQKALDRDPNDYYALRGQAFAHLHRGHEFWRRMQEEVAMGQKEQGAATFAQAHENYKKSLELLGLCLRRAPNDGEAIYGEAMAAEGASRKLYSNAISYLKLGPENRERAELFAENCLTVINKGIERSKERAKQNPGDSGPRALLGGLYLRKAILYNQLGKNDLALMELKNARDVQQSILDEIDKNNTTAQKSVRECETYWEAWGGNRRNS